jgi:hypothetical protein
MVVANEFAHLNAQEFSFWQIGGVFMRMDGRDGHASKLNERLWNKNTIKYLFQYLLKLKKASYAASAIGYLTRKLEFFLFLNILK